MTVNFDKGAFYTSARAKLGPLSATQVSGFEAIGIAISGAPLAYQAYMLATAWHETNRTMQPVREAYWLSEDWRKTHLRYYPWYGRGYCQLTWDYNYRKADAACAKAGLIKAGEMLSTPDLAMHTNVAAFIMRHGMTEGWFTGVKLSTVLPDHGTATHDQYCDARTIINGHDKSDLIEDYAQAFERALRDAGVS